MKSLILTAALMMAAAGCTAATVPQTSEAQNLVSPPESGKLAYRLADAESAILYVGQDGKAIPVIDPYALQSTQTSPFPENAYDIDPGTATVGTYNGYTSYRADSGAKLTITMLEGRTIGDVYFLTGGGEGIMPGMADAEVAINGPVATLSLKTSGGGFAYNIMVFPVTTERINDTTKRDFKITDNLGTYYLSGLRSSLLNHYNGNRGEDWADYPAKRQIKANGKEIYFGASSGASIIPTAGGMAFSVLSKEVLSLKAKSGDVPATGAITVTDLVVGDDMVDITATITGMDASTVSLYSAEKLSDEFRPSGSAVTSLGGDSYKFSAPKNARASYFYKLVADGGVTSATVLVSGDIEITGGVILTSPSGTRYRLTVADDGTLTTTKEE